MAKQKECEITFDKPTKIYYSGENLSGNIRLSVANRRQIKGIQVTISGYGKVHWTEKEKNPQNSNNPNNPQVTNEIHYNGFKEYLNTLSYVAGYENCNSFDLPSGEYDYQFFSSLPIDLPSTCTEKYGEVKYEVIVAILQPFGFDKTFKSDFVVIESSDLNSNPGCKLPIMESTVSNRCCCFFLLSCCRSLNDQITTEFKLPRHGYIPGERLIFSITVDNESATNIKKGFIKLYKEVTYISSSPGVGYKTDLEEILSKNLLILIPKYSKGDLNDFIDLPKDIRPSTQQKLVKFKYRLKIKLWGKCCDLSAECYLPIIIGSHGSSSAETDSFFENIPVNCSGILPTAPFVDRNNEIGFNFTNNIPSTQKYQQLENNVPVEHKWLPVKGQQIKKQIPRGSFLAGFNRGDEMFVGRAEHEGETLPAKIIPRQSCAFVSWNGKEYKKENFEIFIGNQYTWVPSGNGQIMANSMEVGLSSSGESLYIGRAVYEENHNIGKIQPSHNCCYLSVNGSEISVKNYEILTFSDN